MKLALTYRKVGRGAAVPNYCWELARGFADLFETWMFARAAETLPRAVRLVRFPIGFRSKRLEYGPNTLLNRTLIAAVRARERIDVLHTQDGDMIGGEVVTTHALLRVVYRVFRRSDPEYVAWLPQSPLLWAEDLVYRTHRYRHIIVASEKTKTALRREYGVREDDVSVIPLGVDTEVLKPNPRARSEFRKTNAIAEDVPVLVHVSTDFERKGLRTILRSLALLPEDCVLVVVGAGKAEAFQEAARSLAVRNRILFLGYRADLERVLPGADAFLFPTRFDFFGYPVIEAMACGVPPIVTADAGVANVIEDGRNGYLVSHADDPGELAETIRSVLSLGPASAMSRAARLTAEHCSVARMIAETREVYAALERR